MLVATNLLKAHPHFFRPLFVHVIASLIRLHSRSHFAREDSSLSLLIMSEDTSPRSNSSVEVEEPKLARELRAVALKDVDEGDLERTEDFPEDVPGMLEKAVGDDVDSSRMNTSL